MSEHHVNEGMTLGEVGRRMTRLEEAVQALSIQMTVAIGPVGELKVHVDNAMKDIDELAASQRVNTARLDKMELRAAAVAGGATALVFFVKFLIGK